MKKFSESLREQIVKMINKEYQSYLNQSNCHICKKRSNINTLMIQNIVELEIIAIIQVSTEFPHTTYVI